MSEWGMTELHREDLLKGLKTCRVNFRKYCVHDKQENI